MTYDESEKNIILALTEITTVRNKLDTVGKSQKHIFDKFNKACEIFSCAGELNGTIISPDETRYFDSTNNVLAKYFTSNNEKSYYNELFNVVNFLLGHQGSSEQFATCLSMLFVPSKRIRCFPIRVKITLRKDNEVAETYTFLNLVQMLDDNGSLVQSYYIDIFNDIEPMIHFEDVLEALKTKLTTDEQVCSYTEIDGLNYFPVGLDLKKNFTIFETLTDQGGVDFNYAGYEVDISNAAVDECADLTNYISKKELANHLNSYLN